MTSVRQSAATGLRRFLMLSTGLMTLAASGTALADDAAVAQNTQAQSNTVEEIVVTAQKREERLMDTPVPVTVLNTENLADNNLNRLQDYFDLVPGFIATPDSFDRQDLSIRGISPIGGDPTVGIVIDDIPFGLAGSQQSGFIPDLDPADLERVEILRGPQGTLYGADSMGGLVKFVTRDPSFDEYSGRVEAGVSSVYNGAEPGYDLRASVNVPLADDLALRASAFARQDPGYIDNPIQRTDGVNQTNYIGGRLSVLWAPASNISVKLTGLYQDAKQQGLPEVDVPTAGYPETNGLSGLEQNNLAGTGQDDLRIEDYTATIKAKFGAFDLISLTGYNFTRVPWSVELGTSPADVAGYLNNLNVVGVPYYELDMESKVSQEFRASTSWGSFLDVTLGGFFTHENSNGYFTAYGQDATGHLLGAWYYFDQPVSALDEFAAFGNFTFHIGSRFDLELGGRESFFKSDLGQTITTYVGVTTIGGALRGNQTVFNYLIDPKYRITDDLMVYARVATGYRPGSPNVVLPDTPRESAADTTKSYEIGTKDEFFDKRLSVDASIYYIDWNDIQLQERASNGFAFTGNAGGAKSQGLELTIDAHPWDGLTLGSTFSYDDAVLTKAFPANGQYYGQPGDRLPLTAKFSGSLSAEYDFPFRKGTGYVGAVGTYVGDRLGVFVATPQRQDLPGYTRLDLRTGFRSDAWSVSLYANNVTDTRGLLDGGTGYFYPPARLYILPRTFGVNVAYTF